MRERDFEVHEIVKNKEDVSIKLPASPPLDTEVGFTSFGNKIETNQSDCFCKITNTEGVTRHYVKMGTQGFMFDPWGMFYEGINARNASQANDPVWKFVKVPQVCFENYYRFLTTRSKAYLNQAEREI